MVIVNIIGSNRRQLYFIRTDGDWKSFRYS